VMMDSLARSGTMVVECNEALGTVSETNVSEKCEAAFSYLAPSVNLADSTFSLEMMQKHFVNLKGTMLDISILIQYHV